MVGRWVARVPEWQFEATLMFLPNGEFLSEGRVGPIVIRTRGTYEAKGNEISLRDQSGELGLGKLGRVFDTIKSDGPMILDGDTLRLQRSPKAKGREWAFERVAE